MTQNIHQTGEQPLKFGLIIGAAKCSTTSLFNYLAKHPEVCPSDPKETSFFVKDELWEKGLDEYYSYWRWDPATHRIAMEGSTSYTKMPTFQHAPERIASVPGDFRFVYVVRDPFSRIESHFTHAQYEPAWGASSDMEKVLPYLIDVSRYAYQLEFYERQFGADSLLVLTDKDLHNDMPRVVKRICQHFGIDDTQDLSEELTRDNANKERITNLKALSVVRHPAVKRLISLLPSSFTRFVRLKIFKALGLISSVENERLTDTQRERVFKELAPEMAKLQKKYGIDVSKWGFTGE